MRLRFPRCLVPASLLLTGLLGVPSALEAQATTAFPTGALSNPAVIVDGGRSELQDVWGLAVLAGGRRLALAEAGSHVLTLIDVSTGRRLGATGRPGEGPGEVRLLSNFGVTGDAIWISDASLDRLSLFDAGGRYQRAVRFPSLTAGSGSARLSGLDRVLLSVLGVRTSGNLISRVVLKYGEPPSWFMPGFVPIVETDSRGGLIRVLAWEKQPRTECSMVYPVRGGARSISVPFCAEDLLAIARNGSYLAVVEQRVATGRTGEFAVTLVGPAGDTAYVRRVTVPATRIPATIRDSAVQAIRRSLSSQPGGLQPADRQALGSLQGSVVYPAAGRLMLGEDGVVWVRLDAPGPVQSWLALDTGGRVIGRFAFPRGAEPVASMGSHVWVVQRDDDDVPSIARFTFR